VTGSHRPPVRRRRSLSRRGKIIAAGATAAVLVGGTLGYFTLFPQRAPAFVRSAMSTVGLNDEAAPPPPPPTCPLTGEEASGGKVPRRPALAVKVENAPESRPQAALNDADVVVEEPVEGGYTRFIAIFHCARSDRVGPVRSARTTDPKVLSQFGVPILAFSGAANPVRSAVDDADLVPIDETDGGEAFERDPVRAAPHDLYVDTGSMYRVADAGREAPSPVFSYAETWEGRARRVSSVHLPFSSASDVSWAWSRPDAAWMRAHGEVPHTLEDGSPVSATNVVIQLVELTAGQVVDAAGNTSPEIELTGSGKAYVLRDGRVIVGRWERDSLEDLTTFVAKDGTEITLAPGRTWVELLPNTVSVELSR
jgi:hypothetical protein